MDNFFNGPLELLILLQSIFYLHALDPTPSPNDVLRHAALMTQKNAYIPLWQGFWLVAAALWLQAVIVVFIALRSIKLSRDLEAKNLGKE